MMFASLLQEVDASSEDNPAAREDPEAIDSVVLELREHAERLVMDGDAAPSAWRAIPSSLDDSLWSVHPKESVPMEMS